MIREAILTALKEKGISQRKCAIENGIQYTAFNHFMNRRRALPFEDLEKVLKYLNIELKIQN
jgi:lambda repressor-like predicted transcriptional regulator